MRYKVKNWGRFQHYKDRNPPWIKLHFSLLSSRDWVTLDDASRVLAVACMLVASRSEGEIDGSEGGLAYLQRVAYLSKKPNLKPLIECGFLESASGCKQTLAEFRPETETETETETEKKGAGKPRFVLPDWVPEQEWASYCEMRSKSRHPLTDHAKKLILADLDRLRTEGHDPGAVLDQSTANAWRGVFPLKAKSTADEWAKATREVFGDAA